MDDTERDQLVTEQYRNNKAIYDTIARKLEAIRAAIETCDPVVGETILYLADVHALLSANTPVEAHELAFANVLEATSEAQLRRAVREPRAHGEQAWAVQYHNNKADYILHNTREVDYTHQYELFIDGRFDELHRYKIDHVKGLRSKKAPYSLANCGVTDKLCIDANVARFFGLDPDEDVYDGVVVEKYDRLCQRLIDRAPTIVTEDGVDPYIWQWIVFTVYRDQGIQAHDPWFLAIDDVTGGHIIESTTQKITEPTNP